MLICCACVPMWTARQISVGEGVYKLTKVVTLTPRYVVINDTGIPLEVRAPSLAPVAAA